MLSKNIMHDKMQILENISLKPYNTFGVEASSRYFAEVSTESELLDLLKNPKFRELPLLFLAEYLGESSRDHLFMVLIAQGRWV